MAKRVSDPSQHGWVDVNGKWVWGASGGGAGAGMVISETEPTDRVEGMQWMDTSGPVAMVFVWDGSAWLEMPGSGNVPAKGIEITDLEYLVIGGGGAGGSASGYRGGGGGAGGYRTNVVGDVSGGNSPAEAAYPPIPSGTIIDVIVGEGGYSTGEFTLADSTSSTFDNLGLVKEIASFGGGAGGNNGSQGKTGGSAGGAFSYYSCPATQGTAGQGHAGGGENLSNYGAGGGGGAGSQGSNGGMSGDINSGGNGGDPLLSSIDGLNKSRAGGGGGGGTTLSGGLGGGGGAGNGTGGSGNALPEYSGEPNTGSGGGGCNSYPSSGGSGVVIVRYKSDFPMATGGDITQFGDYFVHTFNSSGTFEVG